MKALGKYLAGHLEVGGRAARGGRRQREKAAGVSRRGGEDTADKWGPLDRETRERRLAREGVNQKGKRISRKDVTDARAVSTYGDGTAGGLAGRARGRAGRKVGRAKSKKKEFPN
jgi:hypothetical protein